MTRRSSETLLKHLTTFLLIPPERKLQNRGKQWYRVISNLILISSKIISASRLWNLEKKNNNFCFLLCLLWRRSYRNYETTNRENNATKWYSNKNPERKPRSISRYFHENIIFCIENSIFSFDLKQVTPATKKKSKIWKDNYKRISILLNISEIYEDATTTKFRLRWWNLMETSVWIARRS